MNIEYDDLVGAALLGFTEALQSYDAQKNSSFRTYAILKMRWAVKAFIRKEYQVLGCGDEQDGSHKRSTLSKVLASLNVRVEYENQDISAIMYEFQEDAETRYVKQDVVRKAWSYVETLSIKKREVMNKRYLNDSSFGNIAKEMRYANRSVVIRSHQEVMQTLQTMFQVA